MTEFNLEWKIINGELAVVRRSDEEETIVEWKIINGKLAVFIDTKAELKLTRGEKEWKQHVEAAELTDEEMPELIKTDDHDGEESVDDGVQVHKSKESTFEPLFITINNLPPQFRK